MTWEAFREYYVANALPTLALSSQATYEATLNVFERCCSPQRLCDIATTTVTSFASRLRQDGSSEATIARHLRHLKAMLRWAHREGILTTVPNFTMPKRVKGSKVMRGRPITTEEFERMLESVSKVVENAAAASWKFYLQGLWESGLWLSESLTLWWDDAPDCIVVDYSHRHPMLKIPAAVEKGNQDRLLAITPAFAKLLVKVPQRERQGKVFKLIGINGKPLQGERYAVGKIVTAIGKAAGVIVDERRKGKTIVRKFASAHDLRRSFGQRLVARGIFPNDLRELMRHEDISTTMKYYVGSNAEATADRLWLAFGDTLGGTPPAHKKRGVKNTANSSTGERT